MNTIPLCKFDFLSAHVQDEVAVVVFDNPDKSVNVLSQAVMLQLDKCLDIIARLADDGSIKGVVFSSAKDGVFIAGADISEIQIAQTLPLQKAYEGSASGKRIFARIKKLGIPSVAAINGRTLGGGLELALACEKIIATSSKQTVFGLPETALQIVPGWGGTQRVGARVGFIGALSLVVLRPLIGMINPKLMVWSAHKAYEAGLVDELVIADTHLLPVAIKVALGSQVFAHKLTVWQKMQRAIFDSSASRKLIVNATRPLQLVLENFMPAQFKGVELVASSFDLKEADGMISESCAFAYLVSTPACKKAVARFFAMQEKKKSSKKD